MKIHTRFITSLILAILVPLGGVTSAFAATPPAPAPAGGTFEQRLAQRKAEQAIALEPRDQQRISGLCVQAQSKIRTLQQADTSVLANRAKVYQHINGRLWAIIGQLKLADKDTFNIEKQLGTFTGLTTAFQATTTSYLQAVDDALVVNCQADVLGFKALLETARFYHADLRAQSANIHAYVANDMKATLTDYVSDLQPKQNTGGQ